MRAAIVCCAALILTAGAVAATTITVSPRLVTEKDPVEVTVSGSTDCGSTERGEPRVDGVTRRITLPVSINFTCNPPIGRNFSETFSLGPLAAGTWTLEALENGFSAATRTLDVEPLSPFLHLHHGFFEISVDWSTPDGSLKGTAYAVPMSRESGYFWFFSGSNPEIYVKVLDGSVVNGHWWVFISSTTNLEFKVTVRTISDEIDPPLITEKTYVSPAGENKNFIDTEFF